MSQKQASDPKSVSAPSPASGAAQYVDTSPLGQEVEVVRFSVSPDFKGKTRLGLPVGARSNVHGEPSKSCPDATPLPEGLRVTWFPQAGIILFRHTRIDTAPGVDPVQVVEEKWLNDSTDAFLWWETRSQVKRVTLPSK